MIEPGRYNARATSGVFGKSSRKGTEYVRVCFEILSGSAQGQQIAWDGYFTDKTEQRTLESLKHCGCTFPENNLLDLEGLGANEVQLVIEHEESKNENGEPEFDENGDVKLRARVKWVNGQVGGIKAELQLDDGAKKSLAQRMKANVAKANGATNRNGRPAQGRAEAASSRGDVDDLPF